MTRSFPIKEVIGGCESTEFGCCFNTSIFCLDSHCSNCNLKSNLTNMQIIGGCESTQFGCCPNSMTPCADIMCNYCPNATLLYSTLIGGCDGTRYGCCRDSAACIDSNCSHCPT